MHPITSRKKLVEEIESRELRETDHFKKKCRDRPHVSSEETKSFLTDSIEDDLLAFTDKADAYPEQRYNMVFDRSNEYYLMVGISFANSHINLVTVFITRKNKGKPLDLAERWG